MQMAVKASSSVLVLERSPFASLELQGRSSRDHFVVRMSTYIMMGDIHSRWTGNMSQCGVQFRWPLIKDFGSLLLKDSARESE
jgi:hypothetical protein